MKLFFSAMLLGALISSALAGTYLLNDFWPAFIYLTALAGLCTGVAKLYRFGIFSTLGYMLAWTLITRDILQGLILGWTWLLGFSVLYLLLRVLGFKKPKTP